MSLNLLVYAAEMYVAEIYVSEIYIYDINVAYEIYAYKAHICVTYTPVYEVHIAEVRCTPPR